MIQFTDRDLLAERDRMAEEGEASLARLENDVREAHDNFQALRGEWTAEKELHEDLLGSMDLLLKRLGIEIDPALPSDYPSDQAVWKRIVWGLEQIGEPSEPKQIDKIIRPHDPDLRRYIVSEMIAHHIRERGERSAFYRVEKEGQPNRYALVEWRKEDTAEDPEPEQQPEATTNGNGNSKPMDPIIQSIFGGTLLQRREEAH